MRGNKYGAKKTLYNGYTYDSKKEAGYAAELDLRKRAKDIKDWDRQFQVELRANGILICKHKIDFRILHNDNSYELVEIKGFATHDWIMRRKLLEAIWLPEHLEYTYTVVT